MIAITIVITIRHGRIAFYPHHPIATFVLCEEADGHWQAWQRYGHFDDPQPVIEHGTLLPPEAARVLWPHLSRKKTRYGVRPYVAAR